MILKHGCLGCHKLGDRGGTLGPDLTYVGDKTANDFDFTRVNGERTVANWLFAYLKSPAIVVVGTIKPDLGLTDEEARELAAYMLSLERKAGARVVAPLTGPAEGSAFDGSALHKAYCSACHGIDGQGGAIRTPENIQALGRPDELIAPALNNPDTLGVASDAHLRMTIRGGRSDTLMQAWAKHGGLSDVEIDRLVAHIRSWDKTPASLRSVSASRGNAHYGRALYRSRCLGCHGRDGQTSVGLALNSASFLAVASDDMLARTIVYGRPNTAMPSWKTLVADQVSDLLAYIRSWEQVPAAKQAVLGKLSRVKPDKLALEVGRTLFESNCALCHGNAGKASPALNDDPFLSVVDDEYLYTAIVRGRPGTAMPAWKNLSVDDLVGLINFLRSWNEHRRLPLEPYSVRGDAERGGSVFQRACASCHGRDAEGAAGPQLVNPVFLASATDAMLRHWIHSRCPGTRRGPSPEAQQAAVELSEAQVNDVVTHLRRVGGIRPAAIDRSTTGNPSNGADLYDFVCAECHGPNGEGLTGSALSNPDFLRSASDGFLLASTVVGRDGTRMSPDVAKIVSAVQQGDAQTALQDIVAFIRHWERNPPIAGIPARYVTGADVDSGRELYTSHCAGCHGKRGNDGWAPTLNNREFLAAANDGFMQATVTRGRVSTAMRPFAIGADGIAELCSEEINNIVAYVRTWAAPENRPTESPQR